jgi:hypothetical protein
MANVGDAIAKIPRSESIAPIARIPAIIRQIPRVIDHLSEFFKPLVPVSIATRPLAKVKCCDVVVLSSRLVLLMQEAYELEKKI